MIRSVSGIQRTSSSQFSPLLMVHFGEKVSNSMCLDHFVQAPLPRISRIGPRSPRGLRKKKGPKGQKTKSKSSRCAKSQHHVSNVSVLPRAQSRDEDEMYSQMSQRGGDLLDNLILKQKEQIHHSPKRPKSPKKKRKRNMKDPFAVQLPSSLRSSASPSKRQKFGSFCISMHCDL